MTNAAELLRLIHNLIRLGRIAEVEHTGARCRVQIGELKTDWLLWANTRAGTTRDWDPPTVGEQVLVFSPGGDLRGGIVLTGLYSSAHPAPESSAEKWRRVFPDGASLSYNHGTQKADITLPGGATLNLVSDGGVTITGDVAIIGNLSATGEVSDGVRSMAGDRDIFNDHTHKQGDIPKPDQQQ